MVTSEPLLTEREYVVVDDAIYNEIGDLLEERKKVSDEERTDINNRVRNLMKARRKLQISFDAEHR